MKIKNVYTLKEYRTEWSNQKISDSANGIDYQIDIQDKKCEVEIVGTQENELNEMARLIWEILALYDGYFYVPIRTEYNDVEGNIDKLCKKNLYGTSKIWIDCATPLARNQRCINEELINKYRAFRECGRDCQRMMKSLINAFHFVKSEAYEKVNVEHTLSLFLNMCDGFVINTYKDGSIKDHIKKIYSNLDRNALFAGLKIIGITDTDNLYHMLGEYRNEIDHYKYMEDSISSYASGLGISMTKINWYLTYFTELALRTAFLAYIGYEVQEDIKSFVANDIVFWHFINHVLPEHEEGV